MNKKTYQQPVTTVVAVAFTSIMAGSLGSGDTPNINTSDAKSGTGIGADSRRGSFWDDDDE